MRSLVIARRLPRLALGTALLASLAIGCGGAEDSGGRPDGPPSDAESAPDAKPAVDAPAADSGEQDALVTAYDEGLDFLVSKGSNGMWNAGDQPNPAYSALVASAMLNRPGGLREADGPVVEQALAFVVGAIDAESGAIGGPYPNYMTSVAVMALAASKRPEFQDEIDAAAKFLKQLQRLEEGNPTYGGIGYGSNKERSDLSNTQYALASLRAAGIPESDPVFQRAIQFLSNVQNRTENDSGGTPMEWKDDTDATKTIVRGDDGGAAYYPGNSKAGLDERPDGKWALRSYGSMTFALLRCYHLAGVGMEDGRVQDAVRWIERNWTLDHNPGMPEDQKLQGLYYMYATMGKALSLVGVETLDVPRKGRVDWRKELSAELLKRQGEDGSWVNKDAPRWWEGDPILATVYALTALEGCSR